MRTRRHFRNQIATLFVVGWAIFVFTASSLEPTPQSVRLTAKPGVAGKPPGVPPANPGPPQNPGRAFNITNSKNGQSILTLANMKPGSSATDTVTISNSGNLDGQLALSKSNLQDTHPNCTTCTLSGVLDVLVENVTNPSQPQPVYSGKLGAMPTVQLGSLAKQQARTYRFTVSFPDGGAPASNTTGDNRYQGASASAAFVWTATRATGPQ